MALLVTFRALLVLWALALWALYLALTSLVLDFLHLYNVSMHYFLQFMAVNTRVLKMIFQIDAKNLNETKILIPNQNHSNGGSVAKSVGGEDFLSKNK